MAESKSKKPSVKAPSEKEMMKAGFYKSYDMRWLRTIPEHPDFYLVAEYDALAPEPEKEEEPEPEPQEEEKVEEAEEPKE